jgi:hypothetical protein
MGELQFGTFRPAPQFPFRSLRGTLQEKGIESFCNPREWLLLIELLRPFEHSVPVAYVLLAHVLSGQRWAGLCTPS